jgi:cell division protein FtsB
MRFDRLTVLTLLLVAALIGTAAWRYQHLAAARERARASAADTRAAQRLKQEIASLRRQPKLAKTRAIQQPAIASQVENAANQAGIGEGPSQLVRIDPAQRPRRLEGSIYQAKPVHIALSKVTMEQLVGMLRPLLEADRGLACKRIHLTAPADQPRGKRWNSDLTLTYLIYRPAEQGGPG